MKNHLLLLFLSLMACIPIAFAQKAATSLNTEEKEIWFDKLIGQENSGIINGKEYFNSFKGANSHAFYISSDGDTGSVLYREENYKKIPLLYDIYTDKLILKHLDNNGIISLIELDKDQVGSFKIFDHHFKKFDFSTTPINQKEFFDVLFESEKLILAAKRSKTRRIDESLNRVELTSLDLFFLIHNGLWIPIKGKKNFLSLTTDKNKRESIKSFIRENRIKINKKTEKDLKNLTEYCSSLLLAPS